MGFEAKRMDLFLVIYPSLTNTQTRPLCQLGNKETVSYNRTITNHQINALFCSFSTHFVYCTIITVTTGECLISGLTCSFVLLFTSHSIARCSERDLTWTILIRGDIVGSKYWKLTPPPIAIQSGEYLWGVMGGGCNERWT